MPRTKPHQDANQSPLNLEQPIGNPSSQPSSSGASAASVLRFAMFAVVALLLVTAAGWIVLRSPGTAATAASTPVVNLAPATAVAPLTVTAAVDQPEPAAEAAKDESLDKAQGEAVDIAPDALLAEVVERYRNLDSYSDNATLKQALSVIPPGAEKPINESAEWPVSLAYAEGNKLKLSDENSLVVTNGKTLWKYWRQTGQYTKSDAPRSASIEDFLDHPALQSLSQHPLGQVFMPTAESRDNPFFNIKTSGEVVAEARDGKPGKLITAKTDMGGAVVPTKIWISDATNLIGAIELDFTELQIQQMARQMPPNAPQPMILSVIVSMNMSDVKTDPNLPADTFAFKPDASAKLVDNFEMPNAQTTEQMVGNSAPDFNAPNLEGKRVKLSDLRGRVVVLDFWATWCGPCRVAMPHMQELSEAYADKAVTVLGVNQDSATERKAVDQMVSDMGLTFPHVIDPEGVIGNKYRVQGIPTTVVIGKDGRILKVFVGFSRQVPDLLAEIIDKELAKKS